MYIYIYFPLDKICYDILPDQRKDCGYLGIRREECENKRNCCFDDTIRDVPWCFKKPTEESLEEFIESFA